jgi:hypothetical protein
MLGLLASLILIGCLLVVMALLAALFAAVVYFLDRLWGD